MSRRASWFSIRTPLPARRAAVVKVASFLLPLAAWAALSYVPFIGHWWVRVVDAGGSTSYQAGSHPIPREDFDAENAALLVRGKKAMFGRPANPYYLPAPHEVARAIYASLTTRPPLPGIPWVHQSLWRSCKVIFWGFLLAALLGVPLGILCGTFDLTSKLFEPFIDFIRYMPAPAFAALCIAALDSKYSHGHAGPAIGIIWIGTFFQMVLVVANTTRQFDVGLLEAAQTLGAGRRSLLLKVILPGILPSLYNDMRILIGWAWTYLIIGELIGVKIGISEFIDTNSRHFDFANVYAGIIMIGLIGLTCDQVLGYLARFLFPWQPSAEAGGLLGAAGRAVAYLWRRRAPAMPAAPAPAKMTG